MSNTRLNSSHGIASRRAFLKGVAYTSALSTLGLSSLAKASNNASEAPQSAIRIMQQQVLGDQSVTLFNQSNQATALDAKQPLSVERTNTGALLVRANEATDLNSEVVVMAAGERIGFELKNTAKAQLGVESHHALFNDLTALRVTPSASV